MFRFLISACCIFSVLKGTAQVEFPTIKTSEEIMINYQSIIKADSEKEYHFNLFSPFISLHSTDINSHSSNMLIQKNDLSYSGSASYFMYLPNYTQGLFCDFEDHINRKRKLRIDFSVK